MFKYKEKNNNKIRKRLKKKCRLNSHSCERESVLRLGGRGSPGRPPHRSGSSRKHCSQRTHTHTRPKRKKTIIIPHPHLHTSHCKESREQREREVVKICRERRIRVKCSAGVKKGCRKPLKVRGKKSTSEQKSPATVFYTHSSKQEESHFSLTGFPSACLMGSVH